MGDEELDQVVRRERMVLHPAARTPEDVEGLLHPDVVEFGPSGQVGHHAELVAMLAGDPGLFGEPEGLEAVALADDVVLVTYRVAAGGIASMRSSVWVRDAEAGWRLRFHQGSRVVDGVPDDVQAGST